MRFVVLTAHHGRVTVSSDFARHHAPEVAACASEGYITTWQGDAFGRVWRPTALGLLWIEEAA